MKRTLRILRRAQADLLEIHEYLATASPQAAEGIVDELLASLERLRTFPESGAVPRDRHLRALGFRTLVVGRYVVFYKLVRSQIRVYRILHQRRAFGRLL